MSVDLEYISSHRIIPEELPEDLGVIATKVLFSLDSLRLPSGKYRLVGSMALLLHGIRLEGHPLTSKPITEKCPGDLDVLVTEGVFRDLATSGQTPGGVRVGPRYFGSNLSESVLRTAIDDSPIEYPIDYINGFYRGSRSRYNKGVVNEPYALLGTHKVITLMGFLNELAERRPDRSTLWYRQAIREQAGI